LCGNEVAPFVWRELQVDAARGAGEAGILAVAQLRHLHLVPDGAGGGDVGDGDLTDRLLQAGGGLRRGRGRGRSSASSSRLNNLSN